MAESEAAAGKGGWWQRRAYAQVAWLYADGIEQDLRTYFGPRADVFLAYAEKCRSRGTLGVGWCWPAFLITFVWFFFRKLYLWGLALLLIPIALAYLAPDLTGGDVTWLLFPMMAKHIVLLRAKKYVQRATQLGLVGEERTSYLSRNGGVTWPAGIVAGVVFASGILLLAVATFNSMQ